jgi:phosphate transport system ATP-binding protein
MEYEPHIKTNNLNVYYEDHHVLKNITLAIPDKKITVIIGPSGCGKSTLLKVFNRLIDLDEGVKVSGEVLVDNENIFAKSIDISRIRKKMGLLLQKPFPLPMSIFDNVAYGPRIHGIKNRRELRKIVRKYLQAVNLWQEVKNRLRTPASKLSLGQQQRLCMARGLAVEPEIIMGDEPTASLDPLSSKFIETKLIELKKDYSIIVVTHGLRQARRIADYVGFIYLGELVEFGPASQVLENPREELTQKYIQGIIS